MRHGMRHPIMGDSWLVIAPGYFYENWDDETVFFWYNDKKIYLKPLFTEENVQAPIEPKESIERLPTFRFQKDNLVGLAMVEHPDFEN